MTKTKSKTSTGSDTNQTIIVFGVDPEGKSRAGRFSSSQRELVTKAVQSLGLQFSEVELDKLDPLLAKLQAGRLYSNGKGFVPFIRKDRLPKIIEALGSDQMGSATNDSLPQATTPAGLPVDWASIEPGHLVIALEDDRECGWWEAIVVSMDEDMLTIKWRDFPKQAMTVRHRSAVALLKPAN